MEDKTVQHLVNYNNRDFYNFTSGTESEEGGVIGYVSSNETYKDSHEERREILKNIRYLFEEGFLDGLGKKTDVKGIFDFRLVKIKLGERLK